MLAILCHVSTGAIDQSIVANQTPLKNSVHKADGEWSHDEAAHVPTSDLCMLHMGELREDLHSKHVKGVEIESLPSFFPSDPPQQQQRQPARIGPLRKPQQKRTT